MFHAMESEADLVSANRPGGYGDGERGTGRGNVTSAMGAAGGRLARFLSRSIGIAALADQTSFGRCPGQAPLT